jgi:hypothetical protein
MAPVGAKARTLDEAGITVGFLLAFLRWHIAVCSIPTMAARFSCDTLLGLRNLRVCAVGAPFSFRETLKLRKYSWDAGDPGAWYLDVPEDNFDPECEFLREEMRPPDGESVVPEFTPPRRHPR